MGLSPEPLVKEILHCSLGHQVSRRVTGDHAQSEHPGGVCGASDIQGVEPSYALAIAFFAQGFLRFVYRYARPHHLRNLVQQHF